MDRDYPLFLEEDEQFHNPALVVGGHRKVDHCEDMLPIVFDLGPLVLVNHVLDRIWVEREPLLERGEFFVAGILGIDPKQLPWRDLARKLLDGLGGRAAPIVGTIMLQERESDQSAAPFPVEGKNTLRIISYHDDQN